MPLVIESEDGEELAREWVRLTGKTIADAVTRALREQIERLHSAHIGGLVAGGKER